MKTLREYLALVEDDFLGRLAAGMDMTPERERELTQKARERRRSEDPKAHLAWLKARFEKTRADAKAAAANGKSGSSELIWKSIEQETEYLRMLKDLGGKVPQGRKSKPEQLKTGRPNDFYDEVVKAGMYTFGAESDDFDRNTVKDWVAHHRKLFSKGKVRVFRTIQVDNDWVRNLKAGTEVGNHWTWALEEDVFNGFDMRMNNRTKPIITIEADIETRDIHAATTVAYNCCFEHECEIFLQQFARPVIVAIRLFDHDTHKVGEANLRPDLVGEELAV